MSSSPAFSLELCETERKRLRGWHPGERPEKASIVVVGDRAKIEEKVKALNLGEVVLLDVEGRPVGK